MNSNEWTWAELNGEQLGLLKEGEETLGVDILLAYQQDERAQVKSEIMDQLSLRASNLDDSQLECLQGLETRIQAVVVAYQRSV
jgi:hypothetical protein